MIVGVGVAGRIGAIAAICMLATASVASANPLQLGSDGRGVRVIERHGLTFVFEPAAVARYREIAGRTVDIVCDRVTGVLTGWMFDSVEASAEAVARATLSQVSTERSMSGDFCSLGVLTDRFEDRVVAIVPLTIRGQDYLSQEDTALDVETVWVRPASLKLFGGVTLRTDDSTPPAGKVGLYAHGDQEYVAERDRAGVSLFFQDDGALLDSDLGTGYLLENPAARGPYIGQTLAVPPERLVWEFAA